MRLRKNLKLLAAVHYPSNDVASSSTCPQPLNTNHNHNNASSSSSRPARLVCKLNRSPWDTEKPSQLEGGEYSLSGTVVSVGQLSATLNSVSNTLVDDDDIVAVHRPPRKNKSNSKNYRENIENGVAVIPSRCSKGDGKGWWCKKEAKQGHSLCDHHLYPRSSNHHHDTDNDNDNYNGNNVAPSRPSQPGNKRSDKAVPPPPPLPVKTVRRGGRVLKKASDFNSNPYEFYYYSGFGPKWGKRRGGGGRSAAEDKNNAGAENRKDGMLSSEASLSSMDNSNENENSSSNNGGRGGVIEFMDDFDDDEDDEDNEEGKNGKGKKRGRKMVKARSLKSLM